MKNVTDLTADGFERDVLRAALPVVVDFYAPWCGPCKMLAPLLEQIAAELQGRMKFTKLNVDEAPEWAGHYGITGVPTLALFCGGEQVDALVGLPSPRALKSWLEEAALAAPQAPVTSSL